METYYTKWYSHNLGRDMEVKVYGHSGKPLLFIPCQDGRFFDFENYNMAQTFAPWIESGQVMVLSVDTIDKETWDPKAGEPFWRIRRHEAWIRYLTQEAIPFIKNRAWEKCGWTGGVFTFGCSLGASHAANLFFRFPDLVCGCLAISGIYSAEYGFGDYMDEVVYENSPVHYLANLSYGHPYIEKYNRGKPILCVGTGAWELPDTTYRLDAICKDKGIHAWVDIWGSDVNHDWPWWHRMVPYFLPKLLED